MGGNFHQVWNGLTRSPHLFVVFFCFPLLAFAGSVLLVVRMSRGDVRDRPLAIVLLVIGIPWALVQTLAVLVGL
jgi:hypothetical protein